MNLYEISDEYIFLLETGVDEDGVPEEDLIEKLESLDAELEEKADNIACVIKQLAAESEAIKAEEKRLNQRRSAKENNADRLKQYLSECLLRVGRQTLETPRNKITFRKSKSVEIEDYKALRESYPEFVKPQEPKIDKTAVKKLLEEGADIPGCRIQVNQNIQIK